MFDVGFWEMAFIGVIALVVIGPERLPGVARNVGLWVGKGRRMLNEVMSDVKKEMREYDIEQVKDLRDDLKVAGNEFKKSIEGVPDSASDSPEQETSKINQTGISETANKPATKKSVPRKKASTTRKSGDKTASKAPAKKATVASKSVKATPTNAIKKGQV